jgi:hypothetical protein
VKRWIATKSMVCRGFGMAMLALAVLCGSAPHEAYAQQGERPFWRGAKQREQREQLREGRRQEREQIQEERRELRQQRQEQNDEARRQQREPGDEVRRQQREREADENQDRALNRAEAQRHFPRLGKRFDDIDGNRDGVITREEVRAFRDARAKARVWAGEGDDPRD